MRHPSPSTRFCWHVDVDELQNSPSAQVASAPPQAAPLLRLARQEPLLAQNPVEHMLSRLQRPRLERLARQPLLLQKCELPQSPYEKRPKN